MKTAIETGSVNVTIVLAIRVRVAHASLRSRDAAAIHVV
jgi:hypothetical protein